MLTTKENINSTNVNMFDVERKLYVCLLVFIIIIIIIIIIIKKRVMLFL